MGYDIVPHKKEFRPEIKVESIEVVFVCLDYLLCVFKISLVFPSGFGIGISFPLDKVFTSSFRTTMLQD